MSNAADLTHDLKCAISDAVSTYDEGDVTDELCRALDVVIAAHVKEASGPAVTGDVRNAVHTAALDVLDGDLTGDDMAMFVERLSRYGVVVLGKGDYDDLRTANRRCHFALSDAIERIDNVPAHMTFSRDDVVVQLRKALIQIDKEAV